MESYVQKVIVPFVDYIISNLNNLSKYYLSIDDIDPVDIQYLAALFIELDNRVLECITENDQYDDIVAAIILLLKNGQKENKLLVAEKIQKAIVDYYEDRMMEMINHRLAVRLTTEAMEGSRKVFVCPQTGETIWAA